ncbi:MAG: hypothetical protein ABI383_06295 [Acidobacteriaceae bacterium]
MSSRGWKRLVCAFWFSGLMALPAWGQNTLPDAPQAQRTAVKATDDEVPRGPDRYVESAMKPGQISRYYARHTFSWGTVIYSAIESGYTMANPPHHFPKEWRQGAAAYGRNYGDTIGQLIIPDTGKYAVGLLDHEDPRYWPSQGRGVFRRTFHALAFTLVDRSITGKRMPAFSNAAGSLAGGYATTLYKPKGFDDVTHFGQSFTINFVFFGIENLLDEYTPEIRSTSRKLHLPVIQY